MEDLPVIAITPEQRGYSDKGIAGTIAAIAQLSNFRDERFCCPIDYCKYMSKICTVWVNDKLVMLTCDTCKFLNSAGILVSSAFQPGERP